MEEGDARLIDVLRYGYRRYLLLRNWRRVVDDVARVICRILGEGEVYVFGSVVEGRYTAASDIDVLVVSERVREDEHYTVDLLLRVEDELNLPPGLIHLHVARPGGERYRWFRDVLRAKLVLVRRCRGRSAAHEEG